MTPRRRSRKTTPKGRGGRGGGGAARGRKRAGKGVLAAVRLAAVVIVVTATAAVGVNLSLSSDGDVDTLRDPATVWSGERVRVEVYNGGGVSGMAREATRVLRENGFDVVKYGNAASFDPDRASEVVDRVGRDDMARAVAATLGIDNVGSDPDPNLYVDVTVVVGREWEAPAEDAPPAGVEGRFSWWDPREWF